MRRFLVIVFSCLSVGQLLAQNKDTLIHYDPDIPPVYINGGDAGIQTFIRENMRYPQTGECLRGKVYVGFTVDTLGIVKDIEIKRGITPSADKEAIRLVNLLKFIPASSDGQLIESKMILPIDFTYESDGDQ